MILCCNLVDLLHVYVWALNEIVWSGTVADITNDVEKDFYLWTSNVGIFTLGIFSRWMEIALSIIKM